MTNETTRLKIRHSVDPEKVELIKKLLQVSNEKVSESESDKTGSDNPFIHAFLFDPENNIVEIVFTTHIIKIRDSYGVSKDNKPYNNEQREEWKKAIAQIGLALKFLGDADHDDA